MLFQFNFEFCEMNFDCHEADSFLPKQKEYGNISAWSSHLIDTFHFES
jgi:hypothetical protein